MVIYVVKINIATKGELKMQKLESKKQVNIFAFLLSATYMVSYLTRINYGAVISEMVTDTGFSKSLLSMALTGSFITYGIGQIISGILGDKIPPKKLITLGFCITLAMNILIPICNNPYQMTAVWCVNGFAQAFMWPPIVKLMTYYLSETDYKESTAKVSWGSSIGTIIIYLVSPIIIAISNWRWVFVFSAIGAIVMIIVWSKTKYNIKPEPKEETEKPQSRQKSPLFCVTMIFVMIAIILQGMLRDGVTTWMPSYISETFSLSNIISILTGVILPIFSIITFQVAAKLYVKCFTNPLTCAAIFFAVGAISSLGLYIFANTSAVISVLLSALLTGCMHGVNMMLICMIPPYFKKYGNVSTASGVINSCTYIGSAISTYGIALLSELIGWSYTILIWFIIAAIGTAICALFAKPFSDKFEA